MNEKLKLWLGRVGTWAAVVALTLLLSWLTGKKAPEIPPVPLPDFVPVFGGWVEDPSAVQKIRDSLEFADFDKTPAGKVSFGDDKDAFLWKAWENTKVLGKLPEPRNQGRVGSCVSFAGAGVSDCVLAMQISGGMNSEYREALPEAIYGGSRVEVGGGHIRGDGSVGAWAAEWVSKWGVLPKGQYGNLDLRQYSESRAREWGRTGVPADLEAIAKQSPIRAVTMVTTTSELKKALAQGYPVMVCSQQGFSARRDAQGFAAPQGRWAHAMAILGYRADRPGFFIWNSWGAGYHSGPRGAGDPPEGGFWADERVVSTMLAMKDSWAFGDAVGFPRKELDWWVRRNPVLPNRPLAAAIRSEVPTGKSFWRVLP